MESFHDEETDDQSERALKSGDFSSSSSSSSSSSFGYCRRNSSETMTSAEDNASWETESSPVTFPLFKSPTHSKALSRLGMRHQERFEDDSKNVDSEVEMMKERFSKLLLGEDMSGSGKGVSTAVTISNSITNLFASVFGQHQKLEPLSSDMKSMWKREMNCLLSVCDYIVEFVPTSQVLQDGTTIEVMTSRPRSDIHMNLPGLRKLDTMLLEILDSFEASEFWYTEKGSGRGNSSRRHGSFRRVLQPQPQPQRNEEKWWLPDVCVAHGGLSEKSRKNLRQKGKCAHQIHKAAMAINTTILSDMGVPHSYFASLPKSGKASVGESIYRYISSGEKFSPEKLLDSVNISSEHEALELADKVEASMYTWRRKACLAHAKSSWEMVKELMSDIDNKPDKNCVFAERAETLLFTLKQRYPELSQTTLDTCKIQCNKDVGKSILESYSRVLESLAFNIVAWIEDVVFVDKTMRNQQ
ncbi:unnamed protein product [Cuscuta campestris]|uniref:PRONE domain-containing protein n=1 Tax=Cuscuta campestris TaxID=132261 RepID=A0A484LEJ1_9ASTE|nr:unnamed protein product [Cuscuta campestris]